MCLSSGQSVPAGLHIRLNMETGTREAKLLEQNEDQPQDGQSTEQVTGEHKEDFIQGLIIYLWSMVNGR